MGNFSFVPVLIFVNPGNKIVLNANQFAVKEIWNIRETSFDRYGSEWVIKQWFSDKIVRILIKWQDKTLWSAPIVNLQVKK